MQTSSSLTIPNYKKWTLATLFWPFVAGRKGRNCNFKFVICELIHMSIVLQLQRQHECIQRQDLQFKEFKYWNKCVIWPDGGGATTKIEIVVESGHCEQSCEIPLEN